MGLNNLDEIGTILGSGELGQRWKTGSLLRSQLEGSMLAIGRVTCVGAGLIFRVVLYHHHHDDVQGGVSSAINGVMASGGCGGPWQRRLGELQRD